MKNIWWYRLATFVAAFLLFQIQPMTSKWLVPRFGGSYLVWGASMVFYQAVLLLGYAYAHAVQRRLGVVRYARLHGLLLLAATVCLRDRFSPFVPPDGGTPLALAVFGRLLVSVGLPVLALSTTSVLIQRWLSVSDLPQKDNPYTLYAASNLGSILGLLTYPLLMEPVFSLETQRILWWAIYGAAALLHFPCMPRHEDESATRFPSAPLPGRQCAGWFLLSAAACAVLVAATNVITFDVASVPLLWAAPLSLYLLAFVLAFKPRPWSPAWLPRAVIWTIILGVHLHLMTQLRLSLPAWMPLLAHLAVLFVVCAGCTSRLVSLKPADPAHLTTFYLVIAFGGLCGSASVSWAVPLLSTSMIEYPLAFALAAAAFAVTSPGTPRRTFAMRPWFELATCLAMLTLAMLAVPVWLGADTSDDRQLKLLVLMITLPVALTLRLAAARPAQFAAALCALALLLPHTEDSAGGATRVARLRNYYGIYSVFDSGGIRYLKHGTTLHGRQHTDGPDVATPLGYHHPSTPIGQIMTARRAASRRVAMIGLGAGALAPYLQRGDAFTIFELDPDNSQIAESCFTYLTIVRAHGVTPRFVFGDGRISLQREPDDAFDLLIVDAFNSGSIPVHLMTVEAFREYIRVVPEDGGLVLLNVSRKVLNLVPIVYANARAAGLYVCEKTNAGDVHPGADSTHWMALTRDAGAFASLTGPLGWSPWSQDPDSLPRPWTDRYSNILIALFR